MNKNKPRNKLEFEECDRKNLPFVVAQKNEVGLKSVGQMLNTQGEKETEHDVRQLK